MNNPPTSIQLRMPHDLLRSIDLEAAKRFQTRPQYIRDAALARLTITDKELIAPIKNEENTRNAA